MSAAVLSGPIEDEEPTPSAPTTLAEPINSNQTSSIPSLFDSDSHPQLFSSGTAASLTQLYLMLLAPSCFRRSYVRELSMLIPSL